MKPGTEVKVVKGDHKGKQGKVGTQSARLNIQKGKIPVVVGNKNQVIWTRPDWVEELGQGDANSISSPIPSPQSPVLNPQPDLEKQILQHLASRKLPRSEAEIAIALDVSMMEIGMALKKLEQAGKVANNGHDYYHLPNFQVDQYVTDGERIGLITSEDKGIFTITFDAENELQCTIEDLRENFQVCGNQLELDYQGNGASSLSMVREGVQELQSKPQVLQQAVHERKPEDSNRQGQSSVDVSIGDDPSGNSESDECRSEKSIQGTQGIRGSLQEGGKKKPVCRKERQLEGGNDDLTGVHHGEVSVSSESKRSGGVCPPAHIGDGTVSGEVLGILRDGTPGQRGSSSHQSQQDGQQNPEPTIDDESRTRQTSQQREQGKLVEASNENGHQSDLSLGDKSGGSNGDVSVVDPECSEEQDQSKGSVLGICQGKLESSDCSREWVVFAEPDNSSADLNGSSRSKSTTMPFKPSEIISTTTSITETSETITPLQEQPTSTQSDFPAITPPTPATEQDYSETNQDSGWMRSVALLRGYLNSSLSSNQKASFIEACEQSLEDLEWQDTLGIARSCYRQLVSEQRNAAPDFLQLPTLTALDGKNSRPGGSTKCDKAARKLGLIADSQLLSVEMMALISGYPMEWTKCLSGLNLEPSQDDCNQESSTAERSSPSKQSSHLSELNTSTPLSVGKQWLDPQRITLKGGTQYRHYIDELYAANPQVVQQYAEMMQAGLWEWEREPLPVAFLAADGKVYAGDCHHRVSAALAAGKEIFIDLRPGELVDAQLHSCQSNVDHGYQLRPKDQRKRIEYFLDILETLDPERSRQLLDSIPNLSEIERRNVETEGRWSARVIAKHLRLTESGYRTVINIQQERNMTVNFAQRFAGYSGYVELTAECDRGNGQVIRAGTVGKLIDFNEKKGAYVRVTVSLQEEYGFYVHPKDLKKTTEPVETVGKNSQPQQQPPTQPTSVKEEISQQAASLGLTNSSTQLLPDVQRNPEPQQQQTVTGDISTWVKNLPEEEFQKVWIAVAAREEIPDSTNEMRSHLEKCSDEKLRSIVFWADTILKSRQEDLRSAS